MSVTATAQYSETYDHWSFYSSDLIDHMNVSNGYRLAETITTGLEQERPELSAGVYCDPENGGTSIVHPDPQSLSAIADWIDRRWPGMSLRFDDNDLAQLVMDETIREEGMLLVWGGRVQFPSADRGGVWEIWTGALVRHLQMPSGTEAEADVRAAIDRAEVDGIAVASNVNGISLKAASWEELASAVHALDREYPRIKLLPSQGRY